nr:TetR/AcrR family transcriptional regulator [Micromonospora sp. DSM 115978]
MGSQQQAGAAEPSTREQLLDAAEHLLMSEGYAAVTSRRVGTQAGITPQLVHYYFRTMDDLFLEVFRRRAEAGLDHVREALGTRPTLRELWDLRETSVMTRFSLEFVALANHRKTIQSAIAEYYKKYRKLQLDAFTVALTDLGVPPERCPPLFAQLMMVGVTQIMAIDAELGFDTDYDDVIAFVERQIDGLSHPDASPN